MLRVFIYAHRWNGGVSWPRPTRWSKAHDEGHQEEMRKTDRAAYYNYYTQNRWGVPTTMMRPVAPPGPRDLRQDGMDMSPPGKDHG